MAPETPFRPACGSHSRGKGASCSLKSQLHRQATGLRAGVRMKAEAPDWIIQLERLAGLQGGFFYPWRSRLQSENGETAYTALVQRHLSRDLDVLEPGCGHGVDALRFAPRVHRYRAYDAVEGFLRVARRAAYAQGVSNLEFVLADTSPKRSAGQVRLPADSSSVDLFVSRRGPTHWILDAPRVARPRAVLLQLNPMGGDSPEWEPDLPAGLHLPSEPGSIEDRIAGLLSRAGLNFDEKWIFDVPEYLPDPEQLYVMATWLQESAPRYEDCRLELERLFEHHATDEGLMVRQRRFLWKAVVP